MLAITHILFPFDFSAQAQLAAPFVRTIAERFGARVTLFGAAPPGWDIAPMGTVVAAGGDTEVLKRELQSRLDQALIDELAGIAVERIAEAGDPALRIVDVADARGVDLIMMPTHGLGLFRSLLIGSVTAKVLHDAKCPVWTATHAEEQHGRPLPRAILCAVDGSASGAHVLQWAAEFSSRVGATLNVLHVVAPITDWPVIERERLLQEQVREQARAKVESMLNAAGVTTPLRVAVGEVVVTVTEHARQENADLLVIGRGVLPETLGRLRTHEYGIIQRSPCPVLSV